MVPLTVAIPTFNRPELLERALGSVLAAAGGHEQDFEIVVSDNSTDDRSAEVFSRLTAGWPGAARYVQNRPGIPMVANFNQCLTLASGRFVLILDDDDYLLPEAIPKILHGIEEAAAHDRVLLFGVAVVDERGQVRRRQEVPRERYLGRREALKRVLSNSSFVRAPAIVVRRDAFADVGAFDVALGNPTDLDLYVRLFAAYGVLCLPHTTSVYTVHEAAATTCMFETGTVCTIAAIFENAARRGLLDRRSLRRCQTNWFHQFILAGAYRRLRVADRPGAGRVLRLFRHPDVRRLGISCRWLPAKVAIQTLSRLPAPTASRLVGCWDRLDPDHRVVPAR